MKILPWNIEGRLWVALFKQQPPCGTLRAIIIIKKNSTKQMDSIVLHSHSERCYITSTFKHSHGSRKNENYLDSASLKPP